LLRIEFALPIEADRQKLRDIIENMYPAPESEAGSPLYYPIIIRSLFIHRIVRTDCQGFFSLDAGKSRKPDLFVSYKGRIEDTYEFSISGNTPVVRLTEESKLVVKKGGSGMVQFSEPYLRLSILTASPSFAPRDSYEHLLVDRDGLTFHELADLQYCSAAMHFVSTLLKRLELSVSDEMIDSVSLTFDSAEQNNLIADYKDFPAERGFPTCSTFTRVRTSIPLIIALADAFSSTTYEPTVASLFREASLESKPRTSEVIRVARSFLRGEGVESLPAFMP